MTKRRRVPIYLTVRQCNAALSAINSMLAGEEHDGDWPEGVSVRDLEGAADKITYALSLLEGAE